MRSKYQQYLRKICWFISNPKRKKETYREVRSHILDHIDFLTDKGVPRAEAETRVLNAQPNPYLYGYRLRKAQQSFWQRHLLFLTFVFFAVCNVSVATICIYVTHSQRLSFEKSNPNGQIYADSFERDLQLVQQYNYFTSSYTKNANQFLFQENENKFSPVEIANVEEIYQTARKIWRNKSARAQDFNKIQLSSIETDWMNNLKKFDFLSFLSKKELVILNKAKEKSMLKRIGALASVSSTDRLNTLEKYALIHALKMCHKSQCEQGLEFLNHVSRLLYTSNTIVGQALGVSMLRTRKQVANLFHIKISSLPENVLLAYQSLPWGWRSIQSIILQSPSSQSRWTSYMRPEMGFCSSLVETPFGNFNSMSDFLEPTWPFENDFSAEIRRERLVVTDWLHRCRVDSELVALIEKPRTQEPFWIKKEDSYFFTPSIFDFHDIPLPNLTRVPYIRRVVVFEFAYRPNSSSWGPYERR